MITINGKEFRNLVEQVAKNKEDIAKHYDIEQTLADWGIKVIGRLDTWEEPTGSFAFGDAYAVGPEGGPFDFYIWTRRSDVGNEGYWLNYGPISIVGPQGPQGKQGPQGEPGKANRWYVGPNTPTGDIQEGDMWLKVNSDGTTNGFVYQYIGSGWALFTTILGPQGIQGPEGKQGKQGLQGPAGPQGPRGFTTITNIIGELPEGSIISETYDPSSQPDNATVLMPVGGVQHAWVIINGIWTDAGPYSGGSTVYVGGQAVNSFNADLKLDIDTSTTTYNQVYAKLTNGTQAMLPVATAGTTAANALPRYSATKQLATETPTAANHAANKQYVDNAIAASHNGGSLKSYIWLGQGGGIAGGQLQLGFYYEAFSNLTATSSASVEIPTIQLYYKIGPSGAPYYCVPYGALRFRLLDGTWDSGKYQIDFMDAGAPVGVLQADCYVENGILIINTGYGATGIQYGYAALIVPPSWSSEW